MRKIYFQVIAFIMPVCMLLSIESCKKGGFLAPTTTSNLTEGTVFKDSSNTESFLANIYSQIGFPVNVTRFGNGGLDAASDESEVGNTNISLATDWATGTINAGIVSPDNPGAGNGLDAFNTCYNNIRAVNQILKNIHNTPVSAYTKSQITSEARFLRAYYYFVLLEHYGGMPLVGDTLYTYTDQIPVKRSNFTDCVNYIVSECNAAAVALPTTQTGLGYGRASRGSCLALISRTLLYAASPLFNGTTQSAGTLASIVGYPTADPNRWKLAEDAAAVLIGLNAYSLNVDNSTPGKGFQSLFPLRYNTEYILPLMRPQGNDDLEQVWDPPSRSGSGGAFPYQEIVDAFPMNNGKAINDPTSGYDPNNPYANRDPRLDYSIIHDQTSLAIRLGTGFSPVNIYLGTYNGIASGSDAVYAGTPTGYYTNKMLDPNAVSTDLTHNTNRCLPVFRYAEILLNYAEAANEFEGPTGNVYSAIEQIRMRAGLNPYKLPTGLSKDEMRQVIWNERQIELAFEGHRFWDVRRWMIADQTENKEMTGMEITRTNTTVSYKRFNVRKHNFRKAMYLWPIPQGELAKSTDLVQNTGY
ncbi:MAG: RagB/SusD family nutrient uptake outer membrane protein [Mucilaginibacter sp.]|nr:RagB/SusD family nutrient uptake outer membrane protein [Mucilaginibacter sp.]